MAKRLAQQTVGTKQDVTTFDYSETEWRKIEATLSGLRKYTPPEVIRKHLLESAQRYRSQLLQPKPAQRRRAWQQIVRQCEKLKRAFAIAAEQRLTDLRADWPHELAENVRALYDGQLKALVELQEIANAHVDFYLPRGTYDFDFPQLGFDMNKPHWKFHFAILDIWVRLGGKLRFSRNKKSEISGPLARYFFAVTRPVMGSSTPSLETFRRIVARFKDAIRKTEAARHSSQYIGKWQHEIFLF